MLRVPFFLYIGLKNFSRSGYERAARSFDPKATECDLHGVSVMVTGANQGIGLQVSLELAKRGATLYMVCRNEVRGAQAVSSIMEKTGNANVHLKICDISSLDAVKSLGDEFKQSQLPIHVLVNNAGLMVHGGERSKDGIEMNFATNTLGTYYLTRVMEPVLRKSAPARVIFVSSGGALTEDLEINDLEGKRIQASKDFGTKQYARDKRRQLAIVERLALEWSDCGIGVYAMHPGWTETEGVKTSIPGFYSAMKNRLRSLEQGADTIVWLSVRPMSELKSGEFYLDRSPQSKHLPLSGTRYSPDLTAQLIKKVDAVVQQKKVGD